MLKSFKINDTQFTVLARSPRNILGVDTSENCCFTFCSFHVGKKEPFLIKGEKFSTLIIVCKALASSLMEDGIEFEKGEQINSRIILSDGSKSTKMDPVWVKGTSGETKYQNLVTCPTGTISYAHGKINGSHPYSKPPRIRINKTDYATDWPVKKIAAGTDWPTISEKHMSHTAKQPAETEALIAFGLENLFRLTSLFV